MSDTLTEALAGPCFGGYSGSHHDSEKLEANSNNVGILSVAIVIFILLESLNVLTLYFNPGSRKANGLGAFNAWEASTADPEMHQFIRYLVYWVARTKLILIALLLVILLSAGESTQLLTVAAMIASFFRRLLPIIR